MPYKDPIVKRAKQKEYSRQWYLRNVEEAKLRLSASKKNLRRKWVKFKESLACFHCGFSHPAVIDFHHVVKDPTNRSINALTRARKYDEAFKETEKCIPLCANCHRIFHWKQHQTQKIVDIDVQRE